MTDFDSLLQLIITGSKAVCGGIVALGVLGFVLALIRGKTLFRSLQFGLAVVMVSLLLPGAMAVGAYAAYNATATFMRNAEEAPGVVVRLEEESSNEGGTVFGAIVEYTPPGGSPIEFEDNGEACNPPCKHVGQEVVVLYDPANPANATIKNPFTNWIWVMVFVLLTVVFLLMALWYIVDSFRKDRYWRFFDSLINTATE